MSIMVTEGYWNADAKFKKGIKKVIFGFYLAEAEGDLKECIAIMKDALKRYEYEEHYEHCSVLNDILKDIDY